MQMMRQIQSFRLFLSVIVGGSLLAALQSAHGDGAPSLPVWLGDNRRLLPPVPATAITTMKDALPLLRSEHVMGEARSDQYWKAARNVLELGEQAGLALVWVYAEDGSPSSEIELHEFGRTRERILGALDRDPVVTKWMLPLFRARIDWVRDNLKNGRINDIPFTYDDLNGMEGYLIVHGTAADLDNIHRLTEEIRHSKAEWARNMWPLEGTSEERAARDAERRTLGRSVPIPFYQEYKWCENHLGPVKIVANPTDDLPTQNGRQNRTANEQERNQGTHATSTIAEPRRSWLVWLLVVIAGTVGVMWLVLRKSKP